MSLLYIFLKYAFFPSNLRLFVEVTIFRIKTKIYFIKEIIKPTIDYLSIDL